MAEWAVHEAKSRFSELIDSALKEGPQTITRHGKPTAVVVSAAEYQATRPTKPDFVDFLLAAPKFDLEIERSADMGREIDLG